VAAGGAAPVRDVDRTLVTPTPGELEEALRAAATESATRRPRGLRWPPPGLDRKLARLRREASGRFIWGAADGRPDRTHVTLAWWRDYVGRAPVRISGRRRPTPCPTQPRPGLPGGHPGRR